MAKHLSRIADRSPSRGQLKRIDGNHHAPLRALVLGGCGFIGSHLVDELVAAGQRVTVFDRSIQPAECDWQGVRHFRHELADTARLRQALLDTDLVYHLAGHAVPQTSQLDPLADIEDNLIGTVGLLDAMRTTACRRIVYFSSGGTVYGEASAESIDESHPLRPVSAHGAMKLAIENYLGMYQRSHGIQPIVLRVANAYGPRQGKTGLQGFIGTCLYALLRHEALDIWGDGHTVRDYIHVSDVVRLARLAGESVQRTGTFNVGSGSGISLNDLVALIERIVGRTMLTRCHPPRAFDARHIVLRNEHAAETFGWSPRVPLEQGIQQTWEQLRTRWVDQAFRSTIVPVGMTAPRTT